MGVKVDGVSGDSSDAVDLPTLAEHLKNFQDNIKELPLKDLIAFCTNYLECLARAPSPAYGRGDWETAEAAFATIEEYFHRTIGYLDAESRSELITALLTKFSSIISVPKPKVSPAIAIVIFLLSGQSEKTAEKAARSYIQHIEAQGPDHVDALNTSLNSFCGWLSEFQYRWVIYPNALIHWTLAFIKVLEEKGHENLLIEVSLTNIQSLFISLLHGNGRIIEPVFFRITSCLREIPEVIHKLAPLTRTILETLAGDSEPWSRQLLQNLVELISLLFVEQEKKMERNCKLLEAFRKRYAEILNILRRHMTSQSNRFKNQRPWRRLEEMAPRNDIVSVNHLKVGLDNADNLCYVNSVIQALYLTKQFMKLSIMNYSQKPYWYELNIILAHLYYCSNTTINITKFVDVFRPASFVLGTQNDSSEFFGYLIQLLRDAEDREDLKFDTRTTSSTPASSSADSMPGSSRALECVSPRGRPCKRPRLEIGESSTSTGPKKRISIPLVTKIFGGTVRTFIECNSCFERSITKDNFFDLQLAFPENPLVYPHTVQSLLNYYCNEEFMTGDNRYLCCRCERLQDAYRTVYVEKAPRHLILVLKYFKYDPKVTVQMKQLYEINIEDTIFLPYPQGGKRVLYDLYAAIIHQGAVLNSGHYLTAGRDGGSWYQFNDSKVFPSTLVDSIDMGRFATPYMLFYKRKDIEECSLPPMEELPPVIAETLNPRHRLYVKLRRC